MVWPAIIAAGASLAGSAMSASGQKSTNKMNRDIAREQMAFQERSAKHGYQWATEDMRKAGLNPMLAYSQGGSSALSGAGYTASNPYAGAGEAASGAISSAKALARFDKELELLDEQIKNVKEDTSKKFSEVTVNHNVAAKANADTAIARENLNSAKAQAVQAKTIEQFNRSELGRISNIINKVGQDINPFASSAKSLK